ncbi:MAG: hypothetical protein ACYTDU_13955 [Planctomycetota bacterium]|jgi:hypothetical protein
MARRVALASLLVLAACGIPGPCRLRYGHVNFPAGSRTVYFDVQRHWTEHFTVDGSRQQWKHVGVIAVDLDTFRTRYEKGRQFFHTRAYDHLGRVYVSRYVKNEAGFREQLVAHDAAGRERVLHVEAGEIWGPALAVEGQVVWVFYKRYPNVSPTGEVTGTSALVRVNAGTGEKRELPLPAERRIWDWLTVQNSRFAFLTGRQGTHHRTWRADFEKGTWDKPVEGDFQVIDAKGTLLERRGSAGGSAPPPTTAAIIRNGRRETIDLELPGRIHMLFDTGRVVLFDRQTERYVIRSLAGEADRWLPETPPVQRGVELGTD